MPPSLKNELFLAMKKKVLDISELYDSNGLKITFHIYKGCDLPEKIKVEVTEIL